MKRKTSKWRKVAAAVFFLTVIAWMVFSTAWIANWRNDTKITVYKPIDSDLTGLSFIGAEMFEQLDFLYDTMLFNGYLYNVSEASDDEVAKSLLLAASDVCYKIAMDNKVHWAYRIFVDFDGVIKRKAGFNLEFSPLAIRNGIYKVILQAEEHGEPVARVATGYVIEKMYGHATLRYRPSEPVESIAEVFDWANVGFSSFSLLNDGTLNLAGWGVVDGVNASADTAVYIEVFNGEDSIGTFSTIKENITYIAEYFNDTGYYAAGFKASVPSVSAENLKVRVYVKYDGAFYRCSYHFVPDENMETLVSVSDMEIHEPVTQLYRPSEQVESIAEVCDWANAGFSSFSLLNDGTLNLAGWGVVDGVNASADTEVYIEVFNGEDSMGTFSTTKENITYIAEYFNDTGYYAAGFRASVPGVLAENLKIMVYVKYNNDFYRCSYHFVPDENMETLVSVSDID